MGLFVKSIIGAFVAANTIAGVGAYQGTQELAQNPFLDQNTREYVINHRMYDNLSRAVLGDQGEKFTAYTQAGLGSDDSLDANVSRFLGNQLLNIFDAETTYEKTRLPKMVGLAAMSFTAFGSYAGKSMAILTYEDASMETSFDFAAPE